MSLFDLEAFFRFVREASDEELAALSARLSAFLDSSNENEARANARYFLRRVDGERLARITTPRKQ